MSTYIFDFDGTLVDSMPDWSAKMLNVLNKNNISYPENIIEIITPLGDLGSAKYFIEKLGSKLSTEEMIAQMDEYALPKYRDTIGFKDESVPLYLKKLKSEGKVLCVLTASPHKMLDPCLKRLGIYDLFDFVWSCDDFGTTKSNPQIYLDAVKKAGGTTSDAVFFDDNIGAVKTAKAAELYTVGVYDKSGESFATELKSVCDRYIMSFSDLM